MVQFFHFREQAERCRRLARDCSDPSLRESLLKLAQEYTAQANVQENDETETWHAGPDDDQGVA
jgi:3-methyladenine DNA glycosylase AlkC